MNRTFLPLVLLTLTIASASAAQTAEPQFDAAANSLPAKYAGNDFGRLFQAFTSGGTQPVGRYAFVIELPLTPRWDAAKETYTLTHATTSARVDEKVDNRHPAWVVSTKTLSSEERKAFTALGVPMTVTSREVAQQLLLSRRQGELVSMVDFPVKVPAAEAEALRSRLRLLLIADLDTASILPPSQMVHESRKGATGLRLLSPEVGQLQEVRTYEYTLAGDVVGVWVFDEETGRVLGKFDPEGKPVESTTSAPKAKLSPMQTYELQQQIRSGMSKEQVVAIMGGQPSSIVQTTYAGDKAEAWSYEDAFLAIYFSTAKGTVITTRDLPRR
jgi:hypothetical protein